MLENYEPVSVRLHRLLTTLRADGKEPRIVTVMLSAPGTDVCVFRAELWLGDMLMATGHAEEVRGQGNVNRTSHVENCETSALGRLCESYSPNPDPAKRPSREEMGKVQRMGGAPAGGPPRRLAPVTRHLPSWGRFAPCQRASANCPPPTSTACRNGKRRRSSRN
jgi:hypothetical protein